MIQERNELQNEWLLTPQWREELSRRQHCQDASFDRDKDKLLRREMARLRLKLKLGRGIVRE